jgi:hypothetical protein
MTKNSFEYKCLVKQTSVITKRTVNVNIRLGIDVQLLWSHVGQQKRDHRIQQLIEYEITMILTVVFIDNYC